PGRLVTASAAASGLNPPFASPPAAARSARPAPGAPAPGEGSEPDAGPDEGSPGTPPDAPPPPEAPAPTSPPGMAPGDPSSGPPRAGTGARPALGCPAVSPRPAPVKLTKRLAHRHRRVDRREDRGDRPRRRRLDLQIDLVGGDLTDQLPLLDRVADRDVPLG